MGHATEHYEGNKLKEEQFEWNVWTANKVKEFNGYGKIRNGNEKIADFLANEDAMYAPNPFPIIAVAVVKIYVGGRGTENKITKKEQQQQKKKKKRRRSDFHGTKSVGFEKHPRKNRLYWQIS